MVIEQNMSNNSAISVYGINNAISFVSPLFINILMAVLLLLLGIVIGKIAEKLLHKLFDLIEFNKFITKFTRIKGNTGKTVSRIIAYAIYILFIIFALNMVGITKTILVMIVIILIIVFVLLMIFGTNDLFTNFFAGIYIKFRDHIKIGDYIKIHDKEKNIEGHVISVGTTNIRLETGKDEMVLIPNMAIFKSSITKNKQEKSSHHTR